jgi:uncharacterized protein (DUF58 family)
VSRREPAGPSPVGINRSITPSGALVRCCIIATVTIALGISTHHPQIAVLAAPFVLGPSIYFSRRVAAVSVRLDLDESEAREHDPVRGIVTVQSRDDLDLVVVELDPGGLSSDGTTAYALALRAGEKRELAFDLKAGGWGRRFAGPATIRGSTRGLFATLPPRASGQRRIVVSPGLDVFRASEDVPNALVYAGEHRSSQAGPSMTFSHIRPFSSGDPLRRINWRATLKAQQLHVTATNAERSARVIVAIDAARDVGPAGQSVLDLSVRAAAAITEHYIGEGDIVGLIECGARGRLVRPAPGQRQEDRIREWLLDLRATGVVQGSAESSWLAEMRVSNSLIVVLTPLLDDGAAGNLLALRQRGASLICVDTLAREAQPDPPDRVGEVARRLWLLERARVIHRLGDAGVPVVAWQSNASLESVLRDVARIAAAPRLATL